MSQRRVVQVSYHHEASTPHPWIETLILQRVFHRATEAKKSLWNCGNKCREIVNSLVRLLSYLVSRCP